MLCIVSMKFGNNGPCSFLEEMSFDNVDERTTNGRWMPVETILKEKETK